MSNHASSANVAHLFEPDRDTHYAISEDDELELRLLFQSMETLAALADTPTGQTGPEIEPHNLSPLFLTFARHGQRIMAEARTRFPGKVERKPS